MSWPMVKIGSYIEKIKSWNPLKSADTDSFLYIDLSSVDKDKKEIDPSSVVSILPSDAPSRARQLVKVNDVLVSTVRPNLNGVALVSESFCGATASTGYCVLRANAQKLDSRFLFYWVQTQAFISDMVKKATGANYPAVSDKIIMESEIPLPPLAEQKRIVAILDKADAIRRKRQQAIQLADDFLRAVFLEMFGDPVTNPKGWEFKTVAELINTRVILQVQDGNHGNDHPKVCDFAEDGIPFVTANVVRRGKILFGDCYYLDRAWLKKLRVGFAKPRDVLISHKGSLGFTAVLDGTFQDYIFSPQTTYYRVNEEKILPEYLKAYFDTGFFQTLFAKEGIQSTRAYLGITRQKELPIMIPKFSEQMRFVEVLSKFDQMSNKLLDPRDLSGLFSSLSQKAFSGQL